MTKLKLYNPNVKFLILIIFIGTINRFIYLLFNPSFWLDEASVFEISKLPIIKLIAGNYWDFPYHPFLIYLVMKFISVISISEIILRLPSLVASVITMPILFLISNILFKHKISSFITVILFAVSTYNIRVAGEAKFYSIYLLFGSLSFLYFLKILETDNSKIGSFNNYLLFVVFSFTALLTDYSFFWLYFVYIIYLFISYVSNQIRIQKIKSVTVSLLFILILFTPWLVKFVSELNTSLSNIVFNKANLQLVINTISNFIFYLPLYSFSISYPKLEQIYYLNLLHNLFSFKILNLYNFIQIFFVSTFYIYYFKNLFIGKKNKYLLLILLLITTPIIFSYIMSQFKPIFVHHNLMIVHIGLLFALTDLISNISVKKPIISYSILFTYIILNYLNYPILIKYGYIQDWRNIYQNIQYENLKSEDFLLINPNYYNKIFNYYAERSGNKIKYQVRLISNQMRTDTIEDELMNKKFNKLCIVKEIGSVGDKIYNLEKLLYDKFFNYSNKRLDNNFLLSCYSNKIVIKKLTI